MEKVKINRVNNEVILKFNKKFYSEEHIKQAIKDFNGVCYVKEGENGLILIPGGGVDIDRLGYEFYNYVLGLMKNT